MIYDFKMFPIGIYKENRMRKNLLAHTAHNEAGNSHCGATEQNDSCDYYI